MPKAPFHDISPGTFIWDYGTESGNENLDIGPTLGTSSWRTTDNVENVEEEGYGNAPVDAVPSGTVVELEVPLTRPQLSTLHKLLRGTELTAGGAGGGGDILKFSNEVGEPMFEDSKSVVIRPLINNTPSTNKDTWIWVYNAFPYKAWDLGWNRADQRVMVTMFMVFPNQESGKEGEYYQIGVA